MAKITLRPHANWMDARFTDVKDAIEAAMQEGQKLPQVWIGEYNAHVAVIEADEEDKVTLIRGTTKEVEGE